MERGAPDSRRADGVLLSSSRAMGRPAGVPRRRAGGEPAPRGPCAAPRPADGRSPPPPARTQRRRAPVRADARRASPDPRRPGPPPDGAEHGRRRDGDRSAARGLRPRGRRRRARRGRRVGGAVPRAAPRGARRRARRSDDLTRREPSGSGSRASRSGSLHQARAAGARPAHPHRPRLADAGHLRRAHAYVDAHPEARTDARWRRCAWVAYDAPHESFRSMAWLAQKLGDRTPRVRASRIALQLEAIRAGAGLGLLPCFVGRRRHDARAGDAAHHRARGRLLAPGPSRPAGRPPRPARDRLDPRGVQGEPPGPRRPAGAATRRSTRLPYNAPRRVPGRAPSIQRGFGGPPVVGPPCSKGVWGSSVVGPPCSKGARICPSPASRSRCAARSPTAVRSAPSGRTRS